MFAFSCGLIGVED